MDYTPGVWFSHTVCPFCLSEDGLESSYGPSGTTLRCQSCSGSYTFPCFPEELVRMIRRAKKRKNLKLEAFGPKA